MKERILVNIAKPVITPIPSLTGPSNSSPILRVRSTFVPSQRETTSIIIGSMRYPSIRKNTPKLAVITPLIFSHIPIVLYVPARISNPYLAVVNTHVMKSIQKKLMLTLMIPIDSNFFG